MENLEKLIAKKVKEIKDLEQTIEIQTASLNEKRIFLNGLQEASKRLQKPVSSPKKTTSPTRKGSDLRPGTEMERVYQILKEQGEMHVDKLLEKLEKPVNAASKASLTGSINFYIRKNQIFKRTGPNIFGLIEERE